MAFTGCCKVPLQRRYDRFPRNRPVCRSAVQSEDVAESRSGATRRPGSLVDHLPRDRRPRDHDRGSRWVGARVRTAHGTGRRACSGGGDQRARTHRSHRRRLAFKKIDAASLLTLHIPLRRSRDLGLRLDLALSIDELTNRQHRPSHHVLTVAQWPPGGSDRARALGAATRGSWPSGPGRQWWGWPAWRGRTGERCLDVWKQTRERLRIGPGEIAEEAAEPLAQQRFG